MARPSRPRKGPPPRRPQRRRKRGGERVVEIEVASLGGSGDGIASLDGRPLYLPDALPGEAVRARVTAERTDGFRGEVLTRYTDAPDRREPPCPHFGTCGGCAVQHVTAQSYRVWKRGLIANALAARGLRAETLEPLAEAGTATRRRASFAARHTGAGIALGFNARASREIVDLATCLVVRPEIERLIAPLRALMGTLLEPGGAVDVDVAALDGGLDLLLSGPVAWTLDRREALAAFAEAHAVARFSWFASDGEAVEPLILRATPTIAFDGVRVAPPPGCFLQPSTEGEAALAAFVAEHVGAPARAFDLYAGAGTFTFRLARHAQRVHAVEGDREALDALERAAAAAGLAGRIEAECRDLVRRPLAPAELAGVELVLLDPPRAGAREQAEVIAGSKVPRVIYISCAPGSFARDARTLADAGFRLSRLRPVDQFPWTAHLELAALFERT